MSRWSGKYGPLLIAEIGGNHEGDFEYAKRLLDLGLESDADIIKFQIYSGDTLVSTVESPDRNKHFKKFQLQKQQYIELANRCVNGGKPFMASVWDIEMLSWVDEYMPIYKVGSGDLTAYPLLKAFAERGKPMILSTGLATLSEVIDAVAYIQSVNPAYQSRERLALLQCTSMYPIPAEDANLDVMKSLAATTGLAVGYSDHTEGLRALELAYAMGAEILEFHFTDSRDGKTFRDHRVSLTPSEVRELQARLSDIHRFKGSTIKRPLPVEGDHLTSFRRAVYPRRDLPIGTVLTEADLTVLRPNHGIDAREFERLLGRRVKVEVKRHHKLNWEMFEE